MDSHSAGDLSGTRQCITRPPACSGWLRYSWVFGTLRRRMSYINQEMYCSIAHSAKSPFLWAWRWLNVRNRTLILLYPPETGRTLSAKGGARRKNLTPSQPYLTLANYACLRARRRATFSEEELSARRVLDLQGAPPCMAASRELCQIQLTTNVCIPLLRRPDLSRGSGAPADQRRRGLSGF